MCNNCMSRGCYGCSGRVIANCGNPCFSLGPFRATNPWCPPTGANSGSIIAFSSGITPVALTSVLGDVAGTAALVGFGTAAPVVGLLDTIVLPLPGVLTEAFNVPRNGTVTSISATFTETVGLTIAPGGSATIRAQLYRAPAGSNTFTATNAFVNLAPNITGIISAFDVFEGNATVNLPVRAGDRLVMAFTLETTGGLLEIIALLGSATAGINIA